MFDLPEIQDKTNCVQIMKNALPSCDVKFLTTQKKELSEED